MRCPQTSNEKNQSEDCLILNVWSGRNAGLCYQLDNTDKPGADKRAMAAVMSESLIAFAGSGNSR